MEISNLYQLYLESGIVTTDSRNCPTGSLFFALKGEKFNGNAFAEKALQSGCAYAIVDEVEYIPQGDDRYILTENCLETLQQLANFHRRQLGTPIIGITGTNGKTTTKELIAAVLSETFPILYTQGNLNNQIGVPLTLLNLRTEHKFAVIEMGASHPGDIKELVEIVEPNFGIITNVGKAHLQGFKNLEGVIKTKGELYDFLRNDRQATIFIDHENPYLSQISEGMNKIYYGTDEHLYVNGRITSNAPFVTFEWRKGSQGDWHDVPTHLIGEYNFMNALAAVTIGCYFGVADKFIDKALANYMPTNNRSQLTQTETNTLIIDAYNANPTSMMAALKNFKNMQADNKMIILGDMRELGDESLMEHQHIVDYLQDNKFKNVILVGDQFRAVKHTFQTYANADTLKKVLIKNQPQGYTILIKGSNGIHLNSIIDVL